MKLKFIDQQFQTEAVNSVINLFNNQEEQSIDKITFEQQPNIFYDGYAYINKLTIDDKALVSNMQKIQKHNNLIQTNDLENNNFCVEMETGTGKTFVYIKTILELNRKYGFLKFIIVVPSVAIREGVYKSLQITEQYFKNEYDNIIYNYFIYDSNRLTEVKNFVTEQTIQIMIINKDSFNKKKNSNKDEKSNKDKENIINKPTDKFEGKVPMDTIASTNPIVIMDEPQSIDSTDDSKEAIKKLNALFTLRYSATHKDKMNVLYSLNSVEAYNKMLVKKIVVSPVLIEEKMDLSKAYINLIEVKKNNKGVYSAIVEVDVKDKKETIKRKEIKIKTGEDLEKETKLSKYKGYIVENIDCTKGKEKIEFENKEYVDLDIVLGSNVNMKEQQIKETIKLHLDKELKLIDKNIKVLSLFFIDEVENYKLGEQYGIYAKFFDEHYNQMINSDEYKKIKDKFNYEAKQVRNGYFSTKSKKSETKLEADIKTYNLIMKDKEKLLSFEEPTRFIFSHSALKEGWDNPNVFQICTLINNKTEFTKRQKIGRGLRLCVNTNGERVEDEDREINELKVIVNESYKDFVEGLQNELNIDVGVSILDNNVIKAIILKADSAYNVTEDVLNYLYSSFKLDKYIDEKNFITEKLKIDLENDSLIIPQEFNFLISELKSYVENNDITRKIEDNSNRIEVKLKKEIFHKEDFKDLFKILKTVTTYSFDFTDEELIKLAIENLKKEEILSNKTTITTGEATIKMDNKTGINVEDESYKRQTIEANSSSYIPDILTILDNETNIKRQTISDIIIESGKIKSLIDNPIGFINQLKISINKSKKTLYEKNIKYEIDTNRSNTPEIIFKESVTLNKKNPYYIQGLKKTIYDSLQLDSKVELDFTNDMEKDIDVKLYLKLQKEFKISTPQGNYTPDWAIYYKQNNESNLCFIVETKGSDNNEDLRLVEAVKIKCAEKHFETIQIKMITASNWSKVREIVK